jgi:DNA ligase (NAD+)
MDGAQVTHYTAHHAEFYRSLGAGIGARIVVTRAGDVIPKVLRLAPGQQPDPDLPVPDLCPSCATPLRLRNGKVLECHNAACPPKLRKALDHYAARDNTDIEGLGTEVIEALVGGGHVHSPIDLYRLTANDLAALPLANGQLYGATRTAKLLASIEASRAKPFRTVLHALGAPGVGYPECRTIAQHFSLAELLARSAEPAGTLQAELTALHGIGPATATAFATYLAENAAWISQLSGVGLQVERESVPQAADGPLSGKTFVVTGSLEMGSREDVEAWIRAHGGSVSSSVSSHTTYLIAGVKPGGSKVKAAAKHSVPTLGERDLYALVGADLRSA